MLEALFVTYLHFFSKFQVHCLVYKRWFLWVFSSYLKLWSDVLILSRNGWYMTVVCDCHKPCNFMVRTCIYSCIFSLCFCINFRFLLGLKSLFCVLVNLVLSCHIQWHVSLELDFSMLLGSLGLRKAILSTDNILCIPRIYLCWWDHLIIQWI